MIEDDLEMLSVLDRLPHKIPTRSLVRAYLSLQKVIDVGGMSFYSSQRVFLNETLTYPFVVCRNYGRHGTRRG